MAGTAKKDAIAAFVSQIETAVTDFKLVTDDFKHTTELSADEMPVCLIYEGGDVPDYFLTQKINLTLNVFTRIIGDVDSSVNEVRDLDEACIDAINADVQLGGNAHKCLVASCDPILHWDDTYKYLTRRYLLTYRRDVP